MFFLSKSKPVSFIPK